MIFLKKLLIPILIIALLAVVFLIGCAQPPADSDLARIFSNDSKVMYFYSESCHACVTFKPVLLELADEGYRFKPMNVGEHSEYIEEYNIPGTPTLVGPDGAKLVGVNSKEDTKAFLDLYK